MKSNLSLLLTLLLFYFTAFVVGTTNLSGAVDLTVDKSVLRGMTLERLLRTSRSNSNLKPLSFSDFKVQGDQVQLLFLVTPGVNNQEKVGKIKSTISSVEFLLITLRNIINKASGQLSAENWDGRLRDLENANNRISPETVKKEALEQHINKVAQYRQDLLNAI